MALWILYRKGSFWLKERVVERGRLADRLARLEREGAFFVSVERKDSLRLGRAVELPAAGNPRCRGV